MIVPWQLEAAITHFAKPPIPFTISQGLVFRDFLISVCQDETQKLRKVNKVKIEMNQNQKFLVLVNLSI